MTDLVWVADWQIQCCGEEFAVGDEVEWPVLSVDPDGTSYESLLGAEVAAGVIGTYDAHEDEGVVPVVRGTVRGIRTVSCAYAPLPPPADPREHWPVPGTTAIGQVDAIERWYGTDAEPGGPRFCGWLVDLDLT